MKLNKLFTILMAAAVILGFAGCKNDLTLAEKLVGTGGGNGPSVTYNIDWDTKELVADKTLFSFAYKVNKIVFGYNKDYASVIADTSTYTKYHVGEEETDLIYAYYKAPSDDVTNDGELYVLSDGIIAIKENDKINCEGDMCGPFIDCTSAETIILKNIDTSSLTSFTAFFAHDRKLKTLDISGLDTTNAVTMNMMFDGDESLEAIDLSKFNTSKVTTMEYMFSWCSKLTSLDLSVFDTSKVKNMGSMFTECNGLTELDLSNFSFENVENTETMFCTWHTNKLKTIYVSEGTDLSANTSITDSSMMFDNCTSLVGGKGTVFDSSKTDKTYARIDGGSAAPGYFTKKGDASGDTGESEVLYELDLFGMNIYFGYNKTTCKITNAWLKPDCLGGMNYTLYIPSSSYHDQLLEIDGSKDGRNRDDWGRNGPEGQLLLQIAADSSTASYRLDFIEVITLLQDSGYEYFANIAAAFPDKASPVLPAANTGHDVFYIKDFSNNRYIYDLTNNTVSTIDSSDVSSANNQIVITGDPITLNTKPKTEFPDMTTAVRVSNPCSHQIVIYDDTAELLQIGTVPAVPSNKEEDCCAPLYKTADNKYYQRSGF